MRWCARPTASRPGPARLERAADETSQPEAATGGGAARVAVLRATLSRRGTVAGALACLLTGGASAGERLSAAPCARLLARLPLDDTLGFLCVPASVGDVAVRLMIDTGSNAGLVDPRAVAALGLAAAAAPPIPLRGTGGNGTIDRIALLPLRLGSLSLGRVAMPVGNLPGRPGGTPAVIGFLGGDVLQHFDLDLDLPGRTLSLWSVQPGPGPCALPPGWPEPHDRVALQIADGRPTLPVTLDGHRLTALLDTGARSELLALRAAQRLGLSEAALAGDPGGVTRGVDLSPHLYHWHQFGRLVVGGEVSNRPVLTVARLDEPFDMLLGSAWLRGRRVWISYATDSLFIGR